MTDVSLRRPDRLVVITAVLGGLTVLHDADHLRQGRALPAVLYVVAVAALASIAFTLALLLRHSRWARPAALTLGVATLVGVGLVHVLPQWSSVSDSYIAAGADAASWSIIVAMMLAGAALAGSAVWGHSRSPSE